jgi:RsiW-degrading membrane proteinase PrsW (M82 family)
MRDPRTVNPPYGLVAVGGGLTGLLVLFTPFAGSVSPLAVIPAILVFMLTAAIGAAEREPRSTRLWAFAIGAVVTVPVAVAVSLLAEPALSLIGVAPYAVAGVVEEAVKAGAVWYLARRWRVIDSAIDGVVYGILVAGGFAFTENILYFSAAHGGDLLVETFVVRGLVLPFAHPLFTAASGAAIGWLVGRSRAGTSRWFDTAVVTAGYAVGAFAHGAWNLLSVGETWWYIPVYLVALIALVVGARHARTVQRRRLRRILDSATELVSSDDVSIITEERSRYLVRWRLAKERRKAFDIWVWLWGSVQSTTQMAHVSAEAASWLNQWRDIEQEFPGEAIQATTRQDDDLEHSQAVPAAEDPGDGFSRDADSFPPR